MFGFWPSDEDKEFDNELKMLIETTLNERHPRELMRAVRVLHKECEILESVKTPLTDKAAELSAAKFELATIGLAVVMRRLEQLNRNDIAELN